MCHYSLNIFKIPSPARNSEELQLMRRRRIAIFSAFGMVCYILCHVQFFLYMGWLFFFYFGQNDVPLWIEIFLWCENLSYHLSEQYQGIKLYIFILIFLSKYIHLLSVVFTTYENSQTVKIVNPLLYEYAAVNTIAFQLLLLCKEPLNLNHKPLQRTSLIVNCRLQSFNLQET